jgi:hypothetical protein
VLILVMMMAIVDTVSALSASCTTGTTSIGPFAVV